VPVRFRLEPPIVILESMSTIPTEANLQLLINQVFSLNANFAYLLGSAGTERFHSESDIDIAVHFKKIPSFQEISSLTEPFQLAYSVPVQLIVLNHIDLIFGRQVLETGRLMLCVSPGELLKWKGEQLSAYPDFKFSRQVIEKNILNRKKYV
jgi:predicted nucleotidyltransferase